MNGEQNRNQLPEGWMSVRLGEIFTIERGGSPRPIEDYITNDVNGINWIKIGDTKHITKYISKTQEKIKPEGLKKTRMVYEGDFVLSNSMSFGRPYIMRTSGAIHDGWLVIRKNENVDNDYLYYILSSNSVYAQFTHLAKGSTVKNLNIEAVKQVSISLPSISTQQAIVSKIEDLFSEIDKGIDQLKMARQQLKTYRQAVLKWAFEGKLTNDDVKVGELPEGWEEKEIKEVCENIKVGIVIKPSSFYSKDENGIKAFRSANVREFRINDSDWVYFTEEANEINYRTKLKEGDVLLVRSGYPGTSCIVSKRFEGANAIDILIATPNKEVVAPEYLCYFNNSPLGKGMFKSKSRGVAQKHLNVGEYSKLKISFPSIKEQNQIVEEIESRLSVADKMEENINQSLQQAEVLRQSILKKAFEGKLVQTETKQIIEIVTKEIPVERKILAGKIIHWLHDTPRFGSTRFQKVLFVTEHFAEIGYETHYLQETAGPYDRDFTVAFKREMRAKDWFDEETVRGGGTRFLIGENVSSLIADYPKYFRKKGEQIRFVLELMKYCDTHEAELIATLYAVWNNRLIQKKPVNIDLLTEDFFRWSVKKEREFLEQEIRERYEWMKEVGLVPRGFGKVV